jgi:hypothetical protein
MKLPEYYANFHNLKTMEIKEERISGVRFNQKVYK